MSKTYNITISDGVGTEIIANGTYSVTANSVGYDNTSIDPSSLVIDNSTSSYNLTIGASGSLVLHVTEDGSSSGTAVVGAIFYRCDSSGNVYGSGVTTDDSGNATLANLPYDATNAPVVYYKQTDSDSLHNFDSTLKNIQLLSSSTTVEVTNAKALEMTLNLTDANYENLTIGSATLSLSS